MLHLQKGNFQKPVRWIGGSWMTANQATVLHRAYFPCFGILLSGLTLLSLAPCAGHLFLLRMIV